MVEIILASSLKGIMSPHNETVTGIIFSFNTKFHVTQVILQYTLRG